MKNAIIVIGGVVAAGGGRLHDAARDPALHEDPVDVRCTASG